MNLLHNTAKLLLPQLPWDAAYTKSLYNIYNKYIIKINKYHYI